MEKAVVVAAEALAPWYDDLPLAELPERWLHRSLRYAKGHRILALDAEHRPGRIGCRLHVAALRGKDGELVAGSLMLGRRAQDLQPYISRGRVDGRWGSAECLRLDPWTAADSPLLVPKRLLRALHAAAPDVDALREETSRMRAEITEELVDLLGRFASQAGASEFPFFFRRLARMSVAAATRALSEANPDSVHGLTRADLAPLLGSEDQEARLLGIAHLARVGMSRRESAPQAVLAAAASRT